MSKTIFILLVCFSCICLPTWAAGPARLAFYDRSLWPYPIDSPADFDWASRQEILVFVQVIMETPLASPEQVTKFTGNTNPDMKEVNAYLQRMQTILLNNYQLALKSCQKDKDCFKPTSWKQLVQISNRDLAQLDNKDQLWHKAAEKFYTDYLYEQARLSALFNQTNSEIEKLDPREQQGYELADKHFLLTFDDGPGDMTQSITTELNRLGISAEFFILGTNLEKQTGNLSPTYSNQCIGSHTFYHVPHGVSFAWQNSLDKNKALLVQDKLIAPGQNIAVRPPYGQRNLLMDTYIFNNGDCIMLWNIDSQDWTQLQPQQIKDRLITLMLVLRRGIILFHDTHPKASQVIPQLDQFSRLTKVDWQNCHLLSCRSSLGENNQ